MRVANKTRFTTFVAVVLMAIALVFMVAYAANDTPNIVGYNTYMVMSGDTLWDIAKTSNGYGHIEHQKIVYDIREVSDTSPYIHAGDIVQVPIYEED